MEVADGEVRRFGPGDIVLLEDLTGPGHTTRVVGVAPSSGVFVQLPTGATMKFGLDLTIFGELADPGLLAELAVEAEDAGWDGFFLWDHVATAHDPRVTDPWIALSPLPRVERSTVRLGPMVTPLARRRMTKLARETVALDHLSRGRLILGVGLGANDETGVRRLRRRG